MRLPVYVTSHGRRYHRPSHRMTGSSLAWTTVAQAKRRGYVPCSHCFDDAPPARPAVGRNPSRAYLELKRR